MKNLTKSVIATVLFALPAFGFACEYPERPTLPDGSSASKDQMIAAQTSVKAFLAAVDEDGFVFPGPFDPGDNIKYTQDDTAPQEQKKIGGPKSAVRWHLIGHGDLTLVSTDSSGNMASTMCLVPQPPR